MFSHPLTIAVKMNVASAEQDGALLEVVRKNGIAYINVNPNGGKVLILFPFLSLFR